MTGYEFYSIYFPLHLHFKSSYDVLKYNNKTKSLTKSSFEKRNDHGLFERWANKCQSKEKAGHIVIANLIYNNENFIYQDIQDAFDIYNEWKKVRESLTETFKNDCIGLEEHLKTLCFWNTFLDRTPKGNIAPLLQLYQHKRIHPESLVVFDSISSPFIDRWGEDYAIDPLLTEELFKLKKYRPFVKFNREKVETIFKEHILSNERF